MQISSTLFSSVASLFKKSDRVVAVRDKRPEKKSFAGQYSSSIIDGGFKQNSSAGMHSLIPPNTICAPWRRVQTE